MTTVSVAKMRHCMHGSIVHNQRKKYLGCRSIFTKIYNYTGRVISRGIECVETIRVG